MVMPGETLTRCGTVLINSPTIESAPAKSLGRPATTSPKTISDWPVMDISSCDQAACSTVLTVVWCERASALSASVVAGETRSEATLRGPGPNRSRGPTKVGVSNPANASRHAERAPCISCPASQLMNLRYGTAGGRRCP